MSKSHNATSKKCKKPLDKPLTLWYNKGVKGRNEEIHETPQRTPRSAKRAKRHL